MEPNEVSSLRSFTLGETVEFVGHNGQVQFFEDRIVIGRKGVLGFLTGGLKGDKTIPISSITAVQFRKAGVFANGYIQFTLHGGIESRAGIFDAATDENTVMFRAGEQAERFTELKDLIEKRILSRKSDSVVAISAADELEKFAKLRERGIITDEEFQQKKKSILDQ